MAELVYAYDSKSYDRKVVWVRVPPAARLRTGKNNMVKKVIKRIQGIEPLKTMRETEKEVREKMATLILGGFGLVAALAWNDAIQTLFSTLFPKSNGLAGKIVYAIIVTIIVVFISLRLKQISGQKE